MGDIELDGSYSKLEGGVGDTIVIQDNLLLGMVQWLAMILFGNPSAIGKLRSSSRLAADATFSICPKLFYQCWILFCLGNCQKNIFY